MSYLDRIKQMQQHILDLKAERKSINEEIRKNEEIIEIVTEIATEMELEKTEREREIESEKEELARNQIAKEAVNEQQAKSFYDGIEEGVSAKEQRKIFLGFCKAIGIEIEEIAEENELPPDETDAALSAVGT